MNKIEELIKKYCPDGVLYEQLGVLGEFYSGLTGKKKEDFVNGNANFITYMNVYKNMALDLHDTAKVKIGLNEKQRKLKYLDVIFTGSSETPDECAISSVVCEEPLEDYYLNSFCFIWELNNKTLFNPHFLKHLFRCDTLRYELGRTASGVTRFNVSKEKMKKIKIPVPPFEVQEEIVQILDNFTELTAELTARKQQYEYYRDNLLAFENEKIEWKTLNEVFDIKGGYTPSKATPEFWNKGTIPWFRLEDIRQNGRVLNDAIQHVTDLAVKKSGLFKKNSIIMATTATIGEHAIIKTDFLCNQQLTNLCIKDSYKNLVTPEFAFYYCFEIDKQCKNVSNFSGGIPIVDMVRFRDLKFPIPSIEVQERIVNVLDNFDKICSDLGIGLPAEIESRQKQYEYYRNKLLSFKEKK